MLGQKVILKKAPSTQLIQSGPSIIWDFSELIPNKADTIEFANLDSLCNGSFLPGGYWHGAYSNSDFHLYNDSSHNVRNFANLNDGLFFEGKGKCNWYFWVYTEMKKIIEFPFTYNSSFTDYYEGFISDGWPYPNFSGNISVVSSGYGTLILPNITFDNVLQVYSTDIYHNFPFFDPDTTSRISWYIPELIIPVLELTIPVLEIADSWDATYIDNVITNTETNLYQEDFIQVFPNPCQNVVSLKTGKPIEEIKYEIYNVLGKKMLFGYIAENTSLKIDIKMQGLPTGIYVVKIVFDGKIITKKIIKN